MDTFDAYFPYTEYRPGQRHMLEVVAQCAREGGIAMIDAPPAAKIKCGRFLLAERKGRKVVIAVRTVSQLTTFIRELELVKKKQPLLKTVYLIGKSSMCPLGGEGYLPEVRGGKGVFLITHAERADKGLSYRQKTRSSSSRSGGWTGTIPDLPVFHQQQNVCAADTVGVKMSLRLHSARKQTG